jgi:hypothetical protein
MKTALITFATVAALATSAAAQEVCMSASELQSSLIDWYGERPAANTSDDNTRLWVSDATGSWTLVRTLADGNACVEAQGQIWNADIDTQEMLAAIQARTEG